MRLGVYGGSFDPPHVGHVGAAEYLLQQGLVERLLVVPVFEHAFHKDMLAFDERLELCRLAFAHLPQVEVSELERELPRPNYTVNMLEAVSRQHPLDELRLIIGADVLLDLPRWHRIRDVERLAPLLVLGRVGFETQAAPSPVLPDVASSRLRETQPANWVGQVPTIVLSRIAERNLYR